MIERSNDVIRLDSVQRSVVLHDNKADFFGYMYRGPYPNCLTLCLLPTETFNNSSGGNPTFASSLNVEPNTFQPRRISRFDRVRPRATRSGSPNGAERRRLAPARFVPAPHHLGDPHRRIGRRAARRAAARSRRRGVRQGRGERLRWGARLHGGGNVCPRPRPSAQRVAGGWCGRSSRCSGRAWSS